MQLTISPLEKAGIQVLPPDIVWNGFSGDFLVSTQVSQGPVGGLQAQNPLITAVLLLLFSDVQVDIQDLKYENHGDRRGWVGDGFDIRTDLGEAPLGSRLWTYRRTVLTDTPRQNTLMAMIADTQAALSPLTKQGAASNIIVTGKADGPNGAIRIRIEIYGKNNQRLFVGSFDPLWNSPNGL